MTSYQREWKEKRDAFVRSMKELGFTEELGDTIARYLGSPKAIHRMNSYLYNVKPDKVELIVDEMLAIRSDIDAWRNKKAAEEANAKYNEMLYFGLGHGSRRSSSPDED